MTTIYKNKNKILGSEQPIHQLESERVPQVHVRVVFTVQGKGGSTAKFSDMVRQYLRYILE